MRRRGKLIPVFVIFFFLALLIFFISQKGLVNGLSNIFETAIVPIQRSLFGVSQRLVNGSEPKDLKKLREENLLLTNELVKEKGIEKENRALRDQFETTSPASVNLLPANIIAMNGFLPGVSLPDAIIIDQGSSQGIK